MRVSGTRERQDHRLMRRALALAERGRSTTAPNPRVGCVVTDARGRVVGEGYHRRAGEAHAEVLALEEAMERARDGTLYVNLEPCAHQGRTPPCVEAILRSGIRRVVLAILDPDPRVEGRGRQRLLEGGVEVVVGVEAEAAIALNLPFLVSRLAARPAVTLKWASTLDGALATARGESQWITGPAARNASLALREEHDAILVGIGTILADDPRLTRRLQPGRSPIVRVVLDRRLRLSAEARLFSEPGPVWIYSELETNPPPLPPHAEVLCLPEVEPAAVLEDLGRRGIQSVLVEGGGRILGLFRAAGLWERLELFLAPRLLGGDGARRPLAGPDPERLEDAERLARVSVRKRGPDLQVSGIRATCLQDLSSKLVV